MIRLRVSSDLWPPDQQAAHWPASAVETIGFQFWFEEVMFSLLLSRWTVTVIHSAAEATETRLSGNLGSSASNIGDECDVRIKEGAA